MNKQINTSVIVERTDKDTNSPVVSPAVLADQDRVLAALSHDTPMIGTVAADGPMSMDETISTNAGSATALLDRQESEPLRTRWNEIQGKFVDEPRSAVQQADVLVSEVIEKITQMFANKHSALEGQWNQGNDVSTEDLRQALQRYRSFFNRLVT